MKYLDKNGEELFKGASVDVPTPRSVDDWNFEFSGTVINLNDNYCIVEDMDGNCWAIEPELLELN